MQSPNRDSFLGLKQLPTCSHQPQVVLETVAYKCCLTCATSYMESLIFLVDVFYIRDGELNVQATSYGIRRHEIPVGLPAQTSNESGG